MLVPKKSHSKTPEANAKQAEPGLDVKSVFQSNPVWQTLALAPFGLQARLAVSQPDDPFEQEADQVADRVMRVPFQSSAPNFSISSVTPVSTRRKGGACEDEEEKHLQRKESCLGESFSSAPESINEVLNQPGQPLDLSTRNFFEPRFGRSLNDVRVHVGPSADVSARNVDALAFTIGRHVAFRAGQYSPHTQTGQRLLAHELTHTIQQQRRPGPPRSLLPIADLRSGGVQSPVAEASDLVGDEMPGRARNSALEISRSWSGTDGLIQREPAPGEDVIPSPVDVTWGGDPFNISFERKVENGVDYFYFIIKYTGPHPVDGPSVTDNSKRIGTIIGSAKLNARLKSNTEGKLVVDLEGFGDRLVTLVDQTRFDPQPNKGREHDFDVKVLGESRASGSLRVQDPKAKPEKESGKPSIQEDIPGEKPHSYLNFAELATEIRIDGDGDQLKELLLRLKPKSFWPDAFLKDRVKTVSLEITQISSQKILSVEFDLPEPKIQGALFPVVEDVTDGKAPTQISLILPSKTQWLLVHPPSREDQSVKYIVEAAGRRFLFSFPPEQAPINKIVSAEAPVEIGGIKSIDVTLGSYNDHFRITMQSQAKTLNPSSPPKAIFGISALYRGQPVGGGMGAEIPKLSRNQNIQVIESGGISLTLDIDGEKDHNLRIYDQLTTPSEADGGGPPEKNRNHNIRVVGPEFGEKIFYFTVRDGYLSGGYANPSALDQAARSNALAISGLSEQARAGTFEKQLDAYEGALMAVRRKAADNNVITKATFDAWQGLSNALIKLRPQANANKANPKDVVDSGLQTLAANHAKTLYDSLGAETKGRNKPNFVYSPSGTTSSSTNPYTGETKEIAPMTVNITPGAGSELPAAILAGQWDKVYTLYPKLVDGLDRWIIDRLKETKGESSAEAQQAELLSKRKSALSDLESKKPIAISAVFHPDEKFKSEAGYVAEVPLALYAYKDGDTWYLKNLTNPDKPYHVSASPSAGGEEPPILLFSKLNDPDRFPVGRIHYDVPGRYGGEIRTTDYLTWKKFFTYLGLGLAAVGFTLATFGTGTVAVVGAWALAGSALAGGAAAGIDLAEGVQQGDLTTTRILMDVGQIVASVAGVSALKSGLIVREALTAAEEGAPLVGRAAEMAVFFQKVYVVSTATRIGADAVTLFAFSVDTAKQLDDIQNGPGTQADKDRAKALLLSQLAVSGGLLALSIKGELPKLGGGRKLILHFPDKNGPPVANVGGMEAPTGLKFSQKDVSHLTGDKKLTIEELAESMKQGWKGSAIDIIELPDGSKVSLDNRRLLAAQMAGIKEIPVAYHTPKEKFPAARAAADEFKLAYNIRKLDDGTLVVGGTKGQIVYPKGFRPSNYGEAALVRTANQGNVRPGEKFPLWGSFDQPKIRYPKPGSPSPPQEE